MYQPMKSLSAQELNKLKRRYSEIISSLDSAEEYCFSLRHSHEEEKQQRQQPTANEENSGNESSHCKLDEYQEMISELTQEESIHETECQSKKQRILQLEATVQIVHKLQQENEELVQDKHTYQNQYNETIQVLETEIQNQELSHIQVNRIFHKLTEHVNEKVLDIERQQLELDRVMKKLIHSNQCTSAQNRELVKRNETMSKTLRQREKEVDDMHMELANCERRFQDTLNKTRIQYEDKLMKMSSELDQSNSTSLELCKQRMVQQKMDYERQIQELKQQLMEQQSNNRANSTNSSAVSSSLRSSRSSSADRNSTQFISSSLNSSRGSTLTSTRKLSVLPNAPSASGETRSSRRVPPKPGIKSK